VGLGRPTLRFFDELGNSQDFRSFWGASVAAGYRTEPTALGQFEIAPIVRWVNERGIYPDTEESADAAGHDLALELAWTGDKQNASRLPRRGAAWSAGGLLPIAGKDRPWLLFGDLTVSKRLGKTFVVSLLGRGVATGDDEKTMPTDRWADPGAYWEAPGFDAGRARAREFLRGTLVLRKTLGEMFGVTLAAGASAAWWTLSDVRLDHFIGDDGSGTSVFLEASSVRFGPVVVGLMNSGDEGNNIFVVINAARISWPGPIRERGAAP
jgi:hypothetical protein